MDTDPSSSAKYYDTIGIYVFYLLVYIISFVLIRETPALELFGLIIFLCINLIYNSNLLYDLFSFFSGPSDPTFQLTNWQIFNFVVLVVLVILNITSSIINGITLQRLYKKYTDTSPMQNDPKKAGIKANLSPSNRDKLNMIEIIFICIVCMTGAISLNIYFDSKSLIATMFSLLSNIYSSTFGEIVRILFPVLIFIIGSGLVNTLSKCHGVGELYKYTQLSYGFFLATGILYLLKIGIDYSVLKKFIQRFTYYSFDAIFDILKWIFSGFALLFTGFSIKEYDILAKMPRPNKCFKKGLEPYFISYAVFMIVLYSFTTLNPNHLTKAIYYSIAYIFPLLSVALTSYLVYLSDDLAKLVRHEFVK